MDIKELQLFSSPVWSVENDISNKELKNLIEFAYEAVKRWPNDKPVSNVTVLIANL